MTIKNTLEQYGSVAKLLHWGVFALFVFMFVVAEIMMDMDKGADKWMLYGWHKSTGILLLIIIAIRIIWRISNVSPLLADNMSAKAKTMAHLAHFALYICMIGLPVSGYIMSMAGGHGISFYGLFDVINLIAENKELGGLAHEIHEILATAIYVLVPLHVLAALYHHKILKDDTLTKMLPTKK